MKTYQEQVQDLENTRAAKAAHAEAIMAKAMEEGRSTDTAEADDFDATQVEIKKIDEDLVRFNALAKSVAAKATPIQGADDGETAAKLRQGINVVSMGKSNLPKGVRFARYAMCLMASKGNLMQAEVLARRFENDTPEVGMAIKAAVAAGTTQDATWAAPLVQLQEMASEFVEYLRPQTVLGRIPGIRNVPFNIKFTRQTAGTTGTFVGEGLPKPLGKMDFELLTMPFAKAATIVVLTEELVRFSNPQAEVLARDDLAKGIARYLDLRFLDPAYAGVANVSPASITNGVTPIASLGTSVANITDTIKTALLTFSTANLNLGGLVWIMNPATAISLGLKRTAQDIFAFPDVNATGGTFLGYPVITSNNVTLSASPTEAFLILMDPSEILLADGGLQIDMSTEASLQMSDTPSSSASSMISLWQSNMVGLRAERFIYWRKRRDAAVAVITMNAAW